MRSGPHTPTSRQFDPLAADVPLSRRVESLRLPPEVRAEGRSAGWVVWLVLLVLAGAGGAAACRLLPASLAPPASTSSVAFAPTAAAPADAVAAVPKKASSGDLALESKGYIIPARQILISPKVSGMIVKLDIEEGRRVKKDDVLAVLEDTDYKADRDHAAATLAAAARRSEELNTGNRPEEIQESRHELAEMEAQLLQYESEYKRNTELHKTGAISAEEFVAAETRYHATAARVERLRYALKLMELGPRIERKQAAEAEVNQARAALQKDQWRLDNCTIRAPISGTILKKNAEEGNVVNPIAFNGSFSLCEMADLSDLEVDLSIQERDIARIFVGQRCAVRAEAFPQRVYDGNVSRLMPIADRAKGAISVRVKLTVPKAEEGVYLKPEMGAIVSFYGRAGDGHAADVPAAAPPVQKAAGHGTP